MTKQEERDDPNSTWNKIAEGEYLFILRAQDILAPDIVNVWIDKAIQRGVNDLKINSAARLVLHMQAQQVMGTITPKLPD